MISGAFLIIFLVSLMVQQDREFVEQDLVEAQLNQQTNADSQPQALSLSKKLKMAAKASPGSDCLYSCCRLRRRQSSRVGSGSRKSDPTGEWELNDIESQQQQQQQQGQRSQQPHAHHPLIRPQRDQHQHHQQQPGPSTSKSATDSH